MDVFRSTTIWVRIGAASGIIFVVLTAIGVGLSDPNSGDRDTWPGQSSADIARVLEDNQDNMELGLAIGMVGIFFLIWFVAVIYQRIQSVELNSSGLAVVALGGGLVTGGDPGEYNAPFGMAMMSNSVVMERNSRPWCSSGSVCRCHISSQYPLPGTPTLDWCTRNPSYDYCADSTACFLRHAPLSPVDAHRGDHHPLAAGSRSGA